jgi:hypothetical protein
MRSGSVLAYDAFTGSLRWLTKLGPDFHVYQRPAVASQRLVVVPTDVSLRVYERKSGVRLWQLTLSDLPQRAPACDDSNLVVAEGEHRVRCWLLPHVERYLASLAADKPTSLPTNPSRSIYEAGVSSYEIRRQAIREPQPAWNFQDDSGFDIPPLCATTPLVAFVNRRGQLRLVNTEQGRLVSEWQFPGPVTAAMTFQLVERRDEKQSFWESWLLAPCTDRAVYAFRIYQGKLTPVWQRTLGDITGTAPVLLEQQVFVEMQERGLFCLERDTGEVVWRQPEAHHFVAASPRLVCVLDRLGRLAILARDRGHVLARASTNGQWRMVANRFTDRVYLLSADGWLHCARDRAPECREPRIYSQLRFVPPPSQENKPAGAVENP